MKVSKLAVLAVTAIGSAAALPPAAVAQVQPVIQAPLALVPAERRALAPVAQAVATRNWAAAVGGLAGAQAGARSPAARYALGRLQLDIGVGTSNRQLQAAAVDTILDSGLAPATDVPVLLRHQAQLAFDAGNMDRAAAILTRVTEATPNDPEAWAGLALISRNRNNAVQAVNHLQRSVQLAEARGRVPEHRYQLGLALAAQAAQRPAAMDFARRLVSVYPSPTNWRDAVLTFRDLSQPDAALTLDAMRLMRAAGGLTGERDYTGMATALNTASLGGEAKAVLEEGVARGMLEPTEAAVRALIASTNTAATRERSGLAARVTQARAAAAGAPARIAADSLYGTGRYAEAAELYRLALTKTGEDPSLLNLRLGAALAMAGQRPDAELALGAVTGPRADLAALWLAHLARAPA